MITFCLAYFSKHFTRENRLLALFFLLSSLLLITVPLRADVEDSVVATLTLPGGPAGGGGALDTCSPICPPALPVIRGKKTDELASDSNNNGRLDKGDRIRYQVVINRHGWEKDGITGSDLIPIRDITYLDPVDTKLKVVEGSLFASSGDIEVQKINGIQTIVVTGGEADEISWPLRVEFTTEVKKDLGAGLPDSTISGQGIIYTDNAPTTLTDDPGTNLITDQTLSAKVFEEEVNIAELDEYLNLDKEVRVLGSESIDPSGEDSSSRYRIASVNTLLEYTVSIENISKDSVNDLKVLEPIDRHVNFVPESVTVNGEGSNSFSLSSPPANFLTLDFGQIPPGETIKITYRVRVKPPIPRNLGHLGTRTVVFSGGKRTSLSDDPETRMFGDQTVVLVSHDCQRESLSDRWAYWQDFVENASPGLLPVIINPESRMVSRISDGNVGGAAGERNDVRDEDAAEENNRPLIWILYGRNRIVRDRTAGAAGSLLQEMSEDGKGKDETLGKSVFKQYLPDLAFYGAGFFSLDVENLNNDTEIIAGGSGALSDLGSSFRTFESGLLYGQSSPNLPIYNRFSSNRFLDRFPWLTQTPQGQYCLEEVYLPLIVELRNASGQDLSDLPRDLFNLMIVEGDNSEE